MSPSRDWRPAFEQQTARINASDDTWRTFRRLCLDDGEHVSDVLGRLVDHEVQRRRPAARPTAERPPRSRANASTREQATTKPTERRSAAATSTATAASSAPTLFDA